MKTLKAAIRYYNLRASWLGDGGQPVPVAQAQQRADTCIACPLNNSDRKVWELFTATASKELHHQINLKAQMELHVKDEDKLHVCDACDCYLGLKVWSPLVHILATTPTDNLHADCWVRKEMQ